MIRLAIGLSLAFVAQATAEDFRGVVLNEPISPSTPAPIGTEIEAPYAYTLWSFDDEGLSMSATADAETGHVLYVEMWRTRMAGTQPAPIDGITFGVTTRGDLAAQFGSEGIVFERRGRFTEIEATAVYFISYEIEDSDRVISFATIQPLAEASEETADTSVLDSVILADGRYLDLIWGVNRGRLPDYEPIADPFTN